MFNPKTIAQYTISDELHHPVITSVYRYILLISIIGSVALIVLYTSKIDSGFFYQIETVLSFIFLIDFILRITGSWYHLNVINYDNNNKSSLKKYLFSFYGIVDFLSAMLFFLYIADFKNIDILLTFTLIAILKLARYSPALFILKDVVVSERKTLLAALYVMVILTLSTSTILYFLERDVNSGFKTLLDSIWWATITLATVGYGDTVPVTPLGKAFGALAAISGFGMFALPAGILANGFASEIKRLKEIANWNMVAKVPLFSDLESGVIYEISNMLRVKRFHKDEVVIKEGSYGESMYFIMDGYVEVVKKGVDVYLKKGDFFGEIALLENIPRTATVIAKTRCELLELNRYSFQSFIYSKPDLLEQIKKVAASRYNIK